MYYHEARKAHADVERRSRAHREALKKRRERQRRAATKDPTRLLVVEGRACKRLRGACLWVCGLGFGVWVSIH